MPENIFVSIASYRDPELAATINDLQAKADRPEQINIYVLNQIQPEDDDCRITSSEQVRVQEIAASQSKGVCWARHQIQKALPSDAVYYLQIDSHMRFVPGWDTKMVAMLAACHSGKPVLSCYPVGYKPPDKLGKPMITRMRAKAFNHHGILNFDSDTIAYSQRPAQPLPAAFVAGGFIFAPADAFREVVYDPHLYFIGEEVTLSARLWTHGWDFFAPNDVLIYHNYRPQQRPRHWDDNENWRLLNQLSVERVNYLLAGQPIADIDSLVAIDNYSLGPQRTLADYQQFCGVDFKNQCIRG